MSILKKEPIIRWLRIGITLIVYIALIISIIILTNRCCFLSCIADNTVTSHIDTSFLDTFYNTQISLIVTAIATVSIITSFLNKRYLGANYKYWLFKKTPYLYTPQEVILLMFINQFIGLFSSIFNRYLLVGVASFIICWWLFIYLMYQIYVYVIKVSHLFAKVRKKLLSNRCKREYIDSIYKKLVFAPEQTTEHNSYYREEIQIVFLMMLKYKKNNCGDNNKYTNLTNFITATIENEARVTHNQNTEAIRKIIIDDYNNDKSLVEFIRKQQNNGSYSIKEFNDLIKFWTPKKKHR